MNDEHDERSARPLATGVELIQDLSGVSSAIEGYLRRYRHRVKTHLDDGTRTDVYVADFIDRAPENRDAVAVAVFARPPSGAPPGAARVLLRRQVRYGAYIATGAPLITELICGLIEAPERPEETAARELLEEAGLEVDAGAVKPLGKPMFILPAILTERMFATAVELPEELLRRAAAEHESGDGSPFEQGAEHIVVTLDEALAGSAAGEVQDLADAKTELVLRRLLLALTEGSL